MSHRCIVPVLVFFAAASLRAAAPDAESDFHKAYYLENEKGDLEGAIALYERAASAGTEGTVKQARERLAACREELRARDPAGLVPANSLAYIELRRPGEHVERLLGILGFLDPAKSPIAVSPRLLEALKRIEGAAVAITAVDPRRGEPRGVAVLNAGRDDLLHGLLETALSGAAAAREIKAGPPVGGFPSYSTPAGPVVVTRRLLILGSSPDLA